MASFAATAKSGKPSLLMSPTALKSQLKYELTASDAGGGMKNPSDEIFPLNATVDGRRCSLTVITAVTNVAIVLIEKIV